MNIPAIPRHSFMNDLVIPQEMLEVVAECLDTDEVTLSAFALVSRKFLSACRIHRFRHLVFSNPSTEDRLHAYKQCSALRKLLEETPDLSRHTRRLTLALERPLGNDSNLPWIIQRLNNISSISLVRGCVERVVDWESFSSELQDALFALFRRSTTLTDMVIESYENVPIETIRGAAFLKRVSLQDTRWTPEPSAVLNFASNALACPTSLNIADWRSNQEQRTEMYMVPPKRLFRLENLVELEVVWTKKMKEQFESIFKPCLRSLQVFGMNFTINSNFSERVPVNLSQLVSLRALRAAVLLPPVLGFRRAQRRNQAPDIPLDEFDMMLASLRTLEPDSSRLDSFNLRITAPEHSDITTVRWGDLDGIISRLNLAHPIKTFTIDLRCPLAFPSGSAIGLAIRNNFPLTDALGILTVKTPFDQASRP